MFICFFMACTKEGVEENSATLLSKTWKMHQRTILVTYGGVTNSASAENWYTSGRCYADMLWTYKANGNFNNEPAGSCTAGTTNGIDVLNGQWEWIEKGKSLKVNYLNGNFPNFEFKIIELTPTKLLVQRVEKNPNGDPNCPDWLCEYWFIPN